MQAEQVALAAERAAFERTPAAAQAELDRERAQITPANVRKRLPDDFFVDLDTGKLLDDATVFAEIQSTFAAAPKPAAKERQEWSRLDVLTKHEAYVVERLERRAAEAKQSGDADKAAKICVRLQRTRFLLTRLRNEQRALVQ
jgi:hypothetical protein